ncbi:MAG: class I SAM-dependent methyltransferase [Chitinophagaceae bacterium]
MHDLSIYPGEELVLFEKAVNWKRYFSSFIKPFIKGNVLEAGAGLGANTRLLYNDSVSGWLLLEPDTSMATALEKKLSANELPSVCTLVNGTVSQLAKQPAFDTIIYIDVLEHIESDKEELDVAVQLLKPGGHLVILSPAFPGLFSPFDKAIGHYRRYTKASLKNVIPASLSRVQIRYLDTSGFFLSLANRLFLQKKYPTQKQVNIWDSYCVPVSKITDWLLIYSFGKTILGTWKKNER